MQVDVQVDVQVDSSCTCRSSDTDVQPFNPSGEVTQLSSGSDHYEKNRGANEALRHEFEHKDLH